MRIEVLHEPVAYFGMAVVRWVLISPLHSVLETLGAACRPQGVALITRVLGFPRDACIADLLHRGIIGAAF